MNSDQANYCGGQQVEGVQTHSMGSAAVDTIEYLACCNVGPAVVAGFGSGVVDADSLTDLDNVAAAAVVLDVAFVAYADILEMLLELSGRHFENLDTCSIGQTLLPPIDWLM